MEELVPRHIQEIESRRVLGTKQTSSRPILFWKDKIVGARNNMLLITGRDKSRKSLLATCLNMGRFIKDHEKTMYFNWRIEPDEVILHFDTEMAEDITEDRKRNFDKICNLKPDDERYMVYNLEKYDHQEKLDIIDYKVNDLLINGKTICCLLIDQIGDLVRNRNVNDVESADVALDYLMRWKRQTECLLIPVIHTNRAGSETNGMFGVALDNKTDGRLLVEYDYDSRESSVRHKSRREPIPEFRFTQDEWGDPIFLADESDLFF